MCAQLSWTPPPGRVETAANILETIYYGRLWCWNQLLAFSFLVELHEGTFLEQSESSGNLFLIYDIL